MKALRVPRVRHLPAVFLAALLLACGLGAARQIAAAPADDHALGRRFLDGVEAYDRGEFAAAAVAFEGLVEAGVRNPRLYYDLGNAHLKAGDLGRAMLWYERAARLDPRDPELRYNLEYARGLTADREEGGGVDLSRVFLFWRGLISDQGVRLAALVANGLFWLLLGALRLTRRAGLRGWVAGTGGAALVLLLAVLGNALATSASREAIVLPPEVVVRAGVSDDATELFRLHAGARVRWERRSDGWVRIAFGRDRIGWVPVEAVAPVRFETPSPPAASEPR